MTDERGADLGGEVPGRRRESGDAATGRSGPSPTSATPAVQAGFGIACAVLGVAFLLRAPITSVPPSLATLRADLDLSPALAGATTSLPMVCFGLFAFAAPFVVARLGLERAMLLLVVPIAAGALVRSVGDVTSFFLGTVLIGCGIALGNVLVPSFIRSRFAGQVAVLMGFYTATLQISGAIGSSATVPLEVGLGGGGRSRSACGRCPPCSCCSYGPSSSATLRGTTQEPWLRPPAWVPWGHAR